jgi:hypothetical protein
MRIIQQLPYFIGFNIFHLVKQTAHSLSSSFKRTKNILSLILELFNGFLLYLAGYVKRIVYSK